MSEDNLFRNQIPKKDTDIRAREISLAIALLSMLMTLVAVFSYVSDPEEISRSYIVESKPVSTTPELETMFDIKDADANVVKNFVRIWLDNTCRTISLTIRHAGGH